MWAQSTRAQSKMAQSVGEQRVGTQNVRTGSVGRKVWVRKVRKHLCMYVSPEHDAYSKDYSLLTTAMKISTKQTQLTHLFQGHYNTVHKYAHIPLILYCPNNITKFITTLLIY